MDWLVVLVVLAAAFAHAAWNVFIKMGGDRLSATALMFLFTAVISTVYLPFSSQPWPQGDVWVFLLFSSFIHYIYIYSLSHAYEVGDFSNIYPIARGGAPFVTVIVALVFAVEILSVQQWLAMGLIVTGVLMLSCNDKARFVFSLDKATVLALFIAFLIGIYTLLDGLGARLHGEASSYIAWTFILYGYPFAALTLYKRGMIFVVLAQKNGLQALMAGIVSTGAYMMVTWAMTQAPVGLVAALRETSVLFGLVLAHFILKERFGLWRIVATFIVFGGVLLLRL